MPPRITPLTDPGSSPSNRRLAWLASDAEGVPVGSAFLRLSGGKGRDHRAELEIAVHPAERRAGVGGALLDAALTAARGDGRRSLVARVTAGSPANRFSRPMGSARCWL